MEGSYFYRLNEGFEINMIMESIRYMHIWSCLESTCLLERQMHMRLFSVTSN